MNKSLYQWCIENERNDILESWNESDRTPHDVSYGCSTIINWKCKLNHTWQTTPNKRTMGKNCPYCSNQKVWKGFNDLATMFPDVASRWNYEKNGDLKPDQIYGKSTRPQVWLTCLKGHDFKTTLRDVTGRENAGGCSICGSKILVKGENDLLTICPQVKEFWHPTKNGILKPDDVFPGSPEVVWWICPFGHEYDMPINVKVRKKTGEIIEGCPICSNKRIIEGINDLSTTHPDLAKDWDYQKNGDVLPTRICAGSHNKYWWICSLGHENHQSVESRIKAKVNHCPSCAKESHTSFPEQSLYYYFKKLYPTTENRYLYEGKEIDIFIPDINIGIEYDGKKYHTNLVHEHKKDEFLLSKGIRIIRVKEYMNTHPENSNIVWVDTKGNQVNNLKDAIEEICCRFLNINYPFTIDVERDQMEIFNLYIDGIKKNSIAVRMPKLLSEWDHNKNGRISPYMVSNGSGKTFWWICKLGHEYPASVVDRRKNGCPYCSNQKVLKGFNDLESKYPEIAKEWNYSKNENLLPSMITAFSSSEKVWWVCPKGHEYPALPVSRTRMKSGCPYCDGKIAIAGQNDLFSLYPQLKKNGISLLIMESIQLS